MFVCAFVCFVCMSLYVMYYGVSFGVISRALCVHPAGVDTDETELHNGGSHNSDEGYTV